jgi:ceramide glucosyltransferase
METIVSLFYRTFHPDVCAFVRVYELFAPIIIIDYMLPHSFGPAAIAWDTVMVIAVLGTITSTVFLGLVLVAARRYKRRAAGLLAGTAIIDHSILPGVAVLKPIHGLEPRMEENLESFFLQDYPDFEIIFGTRSPEDPALAVVEKLKRRHPHVRVRVIYSGQPEWPNAKVFSLDKMIASTGHDYFVISDSDILVAPDFLLNVVSPLLHPKNGLVTCVYRGIPAQSFWSEVEAIGMSVELPSGVLVADMLEGMKFALGAVMAVRRDVLDKIGGIGATADYYSDDFVLGSLVAAAGHSVVLSHHKVGHVLVVSSFAKTFGAQLRWAKSTRYSRPSGHIGEGVTYATPFGVLALAAGVGSGHPGLGLSLFIWSVLNRVLQALVVGVGIIRDRQAFKLWLYPVRDFIGFFVWVGSFLGGSSFAWRGELYRFTLGGRIVPATRTIEEVEEPVHSG